MMLVMGIIVVACSSDDDASLSVKFEKSTYNLTNGALSVKLLVSNAPSEAITLPVQFDGSAVMDEDYTVSATSYVIGGEKQMLSIDVTPKNNFTSSKTIIMSVSGEVSASTTINLGVRDKMLYTFAQKAYVLGAECNVVFELKNIKDGTTYVAETDVPVTVAVDNKSTAEEGVNFELVNKTSVVKKGESSCVFTLKALDTNTEKNTIVLTPQVTEETGFVAGNFPVVTISMIGSYASDLMGAWVMDSIVTDKSYFANTWYFDESEYVGLPEYSADDTFTFSADGKNGLVLTTQLSSTLKNYFQPTSDFAIDKELLVHLSMTEKPTLQLLNLSNVNRYFSATEISQDTQAYLGVRNITKKNTNGVEETLLDVYILDYESKTFFPSFISWGMYDKSKPNATMSGMMINFTLKKKK